LFYRYDESSEFKSRAHRCLGDVAKVSMVRQWLCLATEISFDKMNVEPMAARLELVQLGYNGKEWRV